MDKSSETWNHNHKHTTHLREEIGGGVSSFIPNMSVQASHQTDRSREKQQIKTRSEGEGGTTTRSAALHMKQYISTRT
jgi:hypothetical protein